MEAWKKNLQREGTKGREARGGYRNKGKKNKGQQTETGAEWKFECNSAKARQIVWKKQQREERHTKNIEKAVEIKERKGKVGTAN